MIADRVFTLSTKKLKCSVLKKVNKRKLQPQLSNGEVEGFHENSTLINFLAIFETKVSQSKKKFSQQLQPKLKTGILQFHSSKNFESQVFVLAEFEHDRKRVEKSWNRILNDRKTNIAT